MPFEKDNRHLSSRAIGLGVINAKAASPYLRLSRYSIFACGPRRLFNSSSLFRTVPVFSSLQPAFGGCALANVRDFSTLHTPRAA